MTDLIVLAEDATEIAVGQKDRARTMTTNERRLLSMMRKHTGDCQFPPRMAVARLTVQTINAALAWTEGAGLENPVQGLNPAAQFPFFVEVEIGSSKRHGPFLPAPPLVQSQAVLGRLVAFSLHLPEPWSVVN
jgi:hypothetical protein